MGPAKLGRGGEDVVDAGVGYGPPRFDSAGGDGEGDAAEELVPVDLHGAAPIVGGELGKHGGDGGSSEGRENVARGRASGEQGGQQVGVLVLGVLATGNEWTTTTGGDTAAWPAAWRQCRRPLWRGKENFPGNPLATIFLNCKKVLR